MLSNKALLDQLLGENRNGIVKADVHFTDHTVCKYNLIWEHCPLQMLLNRDCGHRHDNVFRTQFNRQWAKYCEILLNQRRSRISNPQQCGDPWGYSYDTMRFLEREANRVDEIVRESQLRADVTKELNVPHPLYQKVCEKLNVLVDEANLLVDEGKITEGTDKLELVQSLEQKKTELISRFVEEYFHFKNGGKYSKNPLLLNPPTEKLKPSPAAAALIAEREQKQAQMQHQMQMQQMHDHMGDLTDSGSLLPPPPLALTSATNAVESAIATENTNRLDNDVEFSSIDAPSTGIVDGEKDAETLTEKSSTTEETPDLEEDEKTRSHRCILSSTDISILGLSQATSFEEAESLLQKQKLRPCFVCGLMLSVSDPSQRVTDHFRGKTHKNFKAMRRLLRQLDAKGPPRPFSYFSEHRSLPEDVFGRKYKHEDDDFFTLEDEKRAQQAQKNKQASSSQASNSSKKAVLSEEGGENDHSSVSKPALTKEELEKMHQEDELAKRIGLFESKRSQIVKQVLGHHDKGYGRDGRDHGRDREREGGGRKRQRSPYRSRTPSRSRSRDRSSAHGQSNRTKGRERERGIRSEKKGRSKSRSRSRERHPRDRNRDWERERDRERYSSRGRY